MPSQRFLPRMLMAPAFIVVLAALGFLTASPAQAGKKDPVVLIQARTEIPEEELLDVGIRVFDPGLPEDDEALFALEEKGVFPEVRESEARYIPFQLMQTLQSTGHWGAVRVVPATNAVDVTVFGIILKSNGKRLEIALSVVDSRGKQWLNEEYKREASVGAYIKKRGVVEHPDPYQSLYNEMANDLLEKRRKLDQEKIQEVRLLSQLKFAMDLAPTPFEDYLKIDKKGRYSIRKLPAVDDPMMVRVNNIRERDFMFIDTLNEFYANFYATMGEDYDGWRAESYKDQDALDKARKEAWIKTLAGVAGIVGGVVSKDPAIRDVGLIGGSVLIKSGMDSFGEAKMYSEDLKQLAASLDAGMAPLLIDMEGEVTRLTGSVETKYATWRNLLRKIFATETGLPIDPNSEIPLAEPGPSNP